MSKFLTYFCFFTFLLISFQTTYAQDQRLSTKTSIQAGTEYDSNVYKTFQQGDNDFLARIFLKNEGTYWANPKFSTGWDYQGGGKKFIHDDAQDQIIQSLSIPFHYIPTSNFQIILEPNVKYQNERNKLDAAKTDINEDFLSTKTQLRFFIGLPNHFNIQPQGSFTYFKFFPNETFSFFREEGGISVEKRFSNIVFGVDYDYFKQQFQDSFRKDSIHEISPYIQYLRNPFIALSYGYQFNNSNDPAFSFHNNKVNFLTSFLFGKRKKRDENDQTQPEARFSLHVIATIQFKKYSSVFSETPEGQRFLVTSSEDENFNSAVVKFNYHFIRNWAVETKYTLTTNNLTNQQTEFSRSLYYAGLRYDF